MNAEFHANDVIGGAAPPARQTGNRKNTPPRRSLAILIVLAVVALGLVILPRPSLYYPHVVIDATDSIQLDFLLNGRQDKAACEAATVSVVNAVDASCSECRTRTQTCIKNPPAELRQRFDVTPLPLPSARMADGIVTYSAPKAKVALMACEESERQAALHGDQTKVRCYPAGAARPHTAFERHQDEAAETTFTLLLAIVGGIIASLIAAILITYARNRSYLGHPGVSPAGIPILPAHPWLEKLTLASVDALILLGTFLALSWPDNHDINRWSRLDRATVIGHGAVIVLTIGWFWLILEHYARRRPYWDELREIFRVLTVMFMVSSALAFVAGLETGRSSHLILWALIFVLIPFGRAGAKQLLDDFGLWQRPAVIIGTGENARSGYLAIKGERGMGYRVLGFVKTCLGEMAPSPSPRMGESKDERQITIGTEALPILTPITTLDALLAEQGNPQLIIALDNLNTQENQELVQQLAISQRNIHVIPAIRGLPLFGTQLSHFFSHQVLFLTLRNNLSRKGYQFLKRAFDIAGAGALLVIFSPLMAYVAWRIWREDGHPVIFHQPRLAKGDGEFKFLKFRSMVKDADKILAQWRENNAPEWQEYYANNFKLQNDPRVLSVGAWIRSLSIDELPQLINVLRGDMSLVGPRPLLARELADYGPSIRFYRQTRPSITGLWQVSGRSGTRFADRAMLDEWYVQNWSLWYDIAILFKTVKVVLQRDGAH